MKNESKYYNMPFEELIEKLELSLDCHKEACLMGDRNMANAWLEQGDFIYKEMRRQGFRLKYLSREK